MKVKSLSHVRLLATPWTAAHQAPPSMGFSRREYWSGVPLPSPHLLHSCLRKLTVHCFPAHHWKVLITWSARLLSAGLMYWLGEQRGVQVSVRIRIAVKCSRHSLPPSTVTHVSVLKAFPPASRLILAFKKEVSGHLSTFGNMYFMR